MTAREIAEPNTILRCEAGSSIFGLNLDDASDRDVEHDLKASIDSSPLPDEPDYDAVNEWLVDRVRPLVGARTVIESWTCEICGDERPDALIAVASAFSRFLTRNVRFCADRPACATAARERADADAARWGAGLKA